MRKPVFAYAKTKPQISCAVTAQLISAFVFATKIVRSLYILNPKHQASCYLLWLYSPVCVKPGRKPRRSIISQPGSHVDGVSFPLQQLGLLKSAVWINEMKRLLISDTIQMAYPICYLSATTAI